MHKFFIIVVALSPVWAWGCRREARSQGPPTVVAPKPDRLNEGEPAPGLVKAFDLQLPRGAAVLGDFGNTIHARSPLGLDDTANFVRNQSEKRPEALIGPERTVFPKVFVRSAGEKYFYRVELSIARDTGGTRLKVDRIENRVLPTNVDKAEAMKKIGLTPDGKIIDRKHLE